MIVASVLVRIIVVRVVFRIVSQVDNVYLKQAKLACILPF
jgi:hypothetical protein